MGLETALLATALGATAVGISQSRAAKKAANPKVEPAKSPQVEEKSESTAKRIGRAALIATSPTGVQTTNPTGRRKLLGN